jgi:hypothetical protein
LKREAMDRIEHKLQDEAKARFPGSAVQRVALLQYGDDPVIEPGELLVRVFIEAAAGKEGREQALHAFEHDHRGAIKEFRNDLSAKLPEAGRLEFLAGDETSHGPRIMLARPGGGPDVAERAGGDLTAVMARLGPVDLETLDTLITAGIATNRAEAVRWALARIRERPAYERLRERAREIDELKTQF